MNRNIPSCPRCHTSLEALKNSSFCFECRFPLRIIQERYILEKELGSGGFGAIYLAKDMAGGDKVVIKFIRTDLFEKQNSDEFIHRFKRETSVTKRLGNICESIVQVFEVGKDEVLGPFYVMEYLQGQTLDQILREQKQLSYRFISSVFEQMTDALHCAHRNGIIHRDLKPANIFILHSIDQPQVKIIDFGITKILENSPHSFQTQGLVGTPKYMSPEQCQGNQITASSDIYSAGCILYEMLTGEPPFQHANPSTLLVEHMTKKPISLGRKQPERDFPSRLNSIVQKALEKKPERRFGSIHEFNRALLQELRSVLEPETRISQIKPFQETNTNDYSALRSEKRWDETFFTPEEIEALGHSTSSRTHRMAGGNFLSTVFLVALPIIFLWGVSLFLKKASHSIHKKEQSQTKKQDQTRIYSSNRR